MPRGIPNTPKKEEFTPSPAVNAAPAPLIIIQPGPDGTYFDCYGLKATEAIDELRLVLLDLVASQADVPIIRSVAKRTNRVVVPAKRAPSTQPVAEPKVKTKPAIKSLPSKPRVGDAVPAGHNGRIAVEEDDLEQAWG